jgi:hypothetical protein
MIDITLLFKMDFSSSFKNIIIFEFVKLYGIQI